MLPYLPYARNTIRILLPSTALPLYCTSSLHHFITLLLHHFITSSLHHFVTSSPTYLQNSYNQQLSFHFFSFLLL